MTWALPKPVKRSTVKARKQRHARTVVKSVRQQCVERDGYCRVVQWGRHLGTCEGVSEWAHLGNQKRFKTRGQPPERRHTTAGSLMLCTKHHRALDGFTLEIVPLTDAGCDGPMIFRRKTPKC